jgi:uncharacterized repeat protein (TIGR01451 family)
VLNYKICEEDKDSVKMKRLLRLRSAALVWGVILALMVFGVTTLIGLAQARNPQAVAADITITKAVEPSVIEPGNSVAYTVVFSNSSASDIALEAITDTLPVPFQYVGLAVGSEVLVEPVDEDEPQIVWQGTFTVPATDTLTLRYLVAVPPEANPSTTPYTNTVTAAYSETLAGPAQAGVTLAQADVQVTKTVWPAEIEAGDAVTYTIVFGNEGNAQAMIDLISDTLPVDFVFHSMLPSSTITEAPSGITDTIVWNGPFTLPAGVAITLTYEVTSSAFPEDRTASNNVVGVVDNEVTEPASATVSFSFPGVYLPLFAHKWGPANFGVTKEASAAEVVKGETVIYTVVLENYGTEPGEIDEIIDKLPSGFTFVSMESGSDVTAAPTGTTGTIVWKGPFPVDGEDTLTLIYKVKVSDQIGVYENEATATALVGYPPRKAAKASVKVKEPYLLYEDFESGREGWEPFLNYWRLYPEQWYLKNNSGYGGSIGMNHTYYYGVTDPRGAERGAHDALLMWQGEGSDEWTDYRIEAWTRLDEGEKGEQMGLWVRGKYTPPADPKIDGKYVQGYYVIWRPRDSRSVILARLRDTGNTAYHFSDPEVIALADQPMYRDIWYKLAVEVRGSNIKVYVNDKLLIDHNDSTWTKGTVGFFCYKIEDATWDEILVTPLD